MFLNMWLATAALTASSRAGPALMRAASTVAAPVLTQTGVNTELKMKILIEKVHELHRVLYQVRTCMQ